MKDLSNLIKNAFIGAFFILLLLVVGCTYFSKGQVIAKYDTGVLYFNETMNAFKNLSNEEKKKMKTIDDYYNYAKNIGSEAIMIEKAYKEGLDKSEKIVKSIEKTKNSAAYNLILKKNVYNKISINTSDYKSYSKTIELYMIIKNKDPKDEAKNIQTKQMLEKLSKVINSLDSFKENAKKFTDDPNSKESGGYIGSIKLGLINDPIKDTLDKLQENKVSEVIDSQYGYQLFYISKIKQIPYKEISKDKEVYDVIYKQKSDKLKQEWYQKLLNDPVLKIYQDKLKIEPGNDNTNDQTVVIEYKKNTITKGKFLETVMKYKQSSKEFTADYLMSVAKNLALKLIMDDLALNKYVIENKDYKEKVNKELNSLLKKEYIQIHMEKAPITEKDMKEFYDKNMNLFTNTLENGKTSIIPYEKSKDFLKFKVDKLFTENARKALYEKLAIESKLEINKDLLQKIKTQIEKELTTKNKPNEVKK